MSDQPIGDVCVLRDEVSQAWTVSICRGGGNRERVGHFATREEAAEFAIAERDRQRAADGRELSIHFSDDCPCICGSVRRPLVHPDDADPS